MKIIENDITTGQLGFDKSNPRTNGEFNLLSSVIKGGEIIFDVGANIGDWSKKVLSISKSVTIHLFEPLPSEFTKLQNNIKSPGTFIHNIAMSDVSCEQLIHYYPSHPALSGLYRRNENVEKRMNLHSEDIKVKVSTVSSFCKENRIDHIDYLKIDTEGNEFNVIRGSESILKTGGIKMIQFEYGACYKDSNARLKQIFEYLTFYGFSVFRISLNVLIHIAEWDYILENFRHSNYLAIKGA
jgi:FkbM family methyltransferase